VVKKRGRELSFVTSSSGGGGGDGMTAQQIIVVEQNTGTQVDHKENYKEVTWENELPVRIEIWENSSKAKKLWTTNVTFTNGDLTEVVKINEDSGVSTTSTITWTNGVPTLVEIT